MCTNPQFRAFFGGPDRPPRALRDLLYSHLAAVPAGGEIAWGTYYFRDQALAQALLQAGRRGVNLRLTLEANPRTAQANRSVIETLRSTGGLRAVKHPWPDNLLWKKPRLHLKLYYFSHPEPHVLLGTFNPSGNRPEDPQVIAEIGDQDRGHNHLVEITGGRLVPALRKHLHRLYRFPHGPWERLLPSNNRVLAAGDTRIYLFPRLRRAVLRRKLEALPQGTQLRMAISHLSDKRMGNTLQSLTRRGIRIEILTHDTERRVPQWVEQQLDGHLMFRRYRHREGLPMHNKFILVEAPQYREIIFGSMNLSERSLHANHELLVVSGSSLLYDAFQERWQQMIQETEARL
jgi:phosphatidylserine/phosphatidylglycerophosphate/cardiolipin synthase-like enzyme